MERHRFPIDVEDDGGAWYVGDEGRGSDKQKKIENWLVFWKKCSMVLRKSVKGWSRITRPGCLEDGHLKR